MQAEWEAALQKQRERVLAVVSEHAVHCRTTLTVSCREHVEFALDNALRLARAIGAAEGCQAMRDGVGDCTHDDDVEAIIRELEGA